MTLLAEISSKCIHFAASYQNYLECTLIEKTTFSPATAYTRVCCGCLPRLGISQQDCLHFMPTVKVFKANGVISSNALSIHLILPAIKIYEMIIPDSEQR